MLRTRNFKAQMSNQLDFVIWNSSREARGISMLKNPLILIVTLYLFTLLQTSFLPHFSLKGFVPNLILILVLLLNFFEESKKKSGVAAAIVGGFFLDAFSSYFMGYNILILLSLTLFIKLILKKYIQPPTQWTRRSSSQPFNNYGKIS